MGADPTEIRPAPELSRTVTGSKGSAVRTAEDGSIATNNYPYGDGFDFDGFAYPYTVDTSESAATTIQELYFTKTGDIDMVITTELGDTIRIPLSETTGSWDGFEIGSVKFEDPNGTNASLKGGWAGEE